MSDDMLEDYRKRVAHLEALLAAEKRENGRLWVAVAHLRSAAVSGHQQADWNYRMAEQDSAEEQSHEVTRDAIKDNIDSADAALLPFARKDA